MSQQVQYTIERRIENVELRRYPETVLATVRGMPDNEAFRILFRYITGNNQTSQSVSMTVPVVSSGERIAMTAPVISEPASFSFVLPPPYTLATSPRPLDPRSTLEAIPPRRVAVLRFRGVARPAKVRRKTQALRDLLKRHEILTRGGPFLMRYNPPYTPGFLRRNEVAIEVAP